MRASASDQLVDRIIKGTSGAIRPVGSHRIDSVSDRKYSRAQTYLLAFLPRGIAAAVVPFVVLGDYLPGSFKKVYSA